MMKARLAHMLLTKRIDEAISNKKVEEYTDLMEALLELTDIWRTEYKARILGMVECCMAGKHETEIDANLFDTAAEAYRNAFYCDGLFNDLLAAKAAHTAQEVASEEESLPTFGNDQRNTTCSTKGGEE